MQIRNSLSAFRTAAAPFVRKSTSEVFEFLNPESSINYLQMCFFMMGWGTHWPAFLYPLLLRNIINQSGIGSREANAALLAQSLIKTVPYPVFQIKAFPGETQLPISATLVVLFLKHHHNSLVPSKTSKLLLNAVVRNPNPMTLNECKYKASISDANRGNLKFKLWYSLPDILQHARRYA